MTNRNKKVARTLLRTHIKGTAEKDVVENVRLLLCTLPMAVAKGLSMNQYKVYLTSRALKHLYDAKPAEEFDFVCTNMFSLIRFPDAVYKNKQSKRGEYVFIKKIQENTYFSSLEVVNDRELDVVTSFQVRKERYLNGYELLWSWEADTPPS